MKGSFWLLWAGTTLPALGDGVRNVAFPLITLTYSGDARSVSLVFAAGYLPWPLFGLAGGVAADRVDRRTLMWVTNVVRAGIAAVLLTVVLSRGGGIAALMLASFLIGTAETVFDSSASSIVPQLVGARQLERANAWLMSAQILASTLAGAVAGALLFKASRVAPLIADAASFVVAAALIAAIRRPLSAAASPAITPTSNTAAGMREGLRWLWGHRVLRAICGLVTIVNGVIAMAETLLVFYAKNVLHLGSLGYSLMLTALALSSVAGSAIAPAVRRRAGHATVLIAGAVLLGSAVVIAGLSSNLPTAIAALTLAGLANGGWNVVAVSLRQAVVPSALLGRVTSIYRTISLTAMPVASVLAGYAAEHLGLHVPFALAGVLLITASAASAPTLISLRDNAPIPFIAD